MDQNLKQKIIERFHLELLPPNEQDEIIADAGNVIMTSVLRRTIPLLSDADGAICDEMVLANQDIAEIFDFIQSKVPRYSEIVDDELAILDKTLNG